MAALADDALQTLQRDVQRLLGRCVLRLQQYERLIKAIVAYHEISGPAHALEPIRAALVAETARKTLGTLIGDLLGSYVVVNGDETPPRDTIAPSESTASFGFRMQLGLSDADFARTENELRELVALRNSLVHHFIDQYDLWTLDGCRDAHDALVAAYSRIDQHFEQLRGWAEHMEQTRRLAEAFVRSNEFRDLVVNGIAADGKVDWSAAGIVAALRKAATAVAVDGWASITEAGAWVAQRFPGCKIWVQQLASGGA